MELNCGTLNESHIGNQISLYGWCRYIRDHGGKLFIDLSDMHGSTQLVFEKEIKNKADKLGKEYVICASGIVEKRDEDTIDKTNPTGKVEIYVKSVDVISESIVPPFELIDEKGEFLANEELRLKYRYLDLRRKSMASNILFRDKITKTARKFFWENGFMELETPYLVKDNYETGSRTLIVPSRQEKGKFYALAQSPQIYKQILMIAGFDKYFQIARCFRDEDPREDRQLEHTQIDFEVAFKDEKYIQDIVERMFINIFNAALDKELKHPFLHIKHEDAIRMYGSDKPDLRFDNKIVDITNELKDTSYNIIKRVVETNGYVKAVAFDAKFDGDKGRIDKNYMLKMISLARLFGLRGLTWIYVKDNAIRSDPESIADLLKTCETGILRKLGAKNGDIIIVGADLSEKVLLNSLGRLRKSIGNRIGIYNTEYSFVWVDEFPLFEANEVTGKLMPAHNPFTSPTDSTLGFLDKNPEKVRGRQYDLVLNGNELGSGAIRINDPKLQKKILELSGMNDDTVDKSFGFFIDALSYGTPTEGGMGLGLDRITAMLAGSGNIRDFILFPKSKGFESSVDMSPTAIEPSRLKNDYGIEFKDT
ncbi:MAG: aspartate--tRNA ligase [Candidatus Micrarchaeaceae archaeon]